MNKIIAILILLSIFTCSKKPHDLEVKAQIKGLQKGTVYLKKYIDTTLVTLDSVMVNGNANVSLYSDLTSPEMFYLFLNKNAKDIDRISFFADKGITTIETTAANFSGDAKITGSEQQKVFEDYQKVISRFNFNHLDIIKAEFEAKKNNDQKKLDSVILAYNNLVKKRYLFTVNFCLNHKDSEVAPYLALTEIYDARLPFLDTINKSLSPTVKSSNYGKQLNEYIEQLKATK